MRLQQVVMLCGLAALGALAAGAANGGEPPFFASKTITITVGSSTGGLYDLIARALARALGRHIDGHPTVIVQNRLGAGGTAVLAYLFASAPADGTALAMIKRSYAIDALIDPGGFKYDPTRLAAIGSTSSDVSVAVAWHTARVQRFEDTFSTELSVGATSATDGTVRYANLVKKLTAAKIRIVPGYPGGTDITLAMERGEIDAKFGWSWGSVKSRARDLLDGKKINILMQMGMAKAPDLPDTPFVMDYAKSDLDRRALELIFTPTAMAWPLVAAPGVPAERIAELRSAFVATMADPQFRSEAEKLDLDIDPVGGADLDATVRRIAGYDAAVVQRARELGGP